jgi:hypothetical protein
VFTGRSHFAAPAEDYLPRDHLARSALRQNPSCLISFGRSPSGLRCSLERRTELMPEGLWFRVPDDGREERYDYDPAPVGAPRIVVIDVEET